MDTGRPQSEGNGVDPFSWPLDTFSQDMIGVDKVPTSFLLFLDRSRALPRYFHFSGSNSELCIDSTLFHPERLLSSC